MPPPVVPGNVRSIESIDIFLAMSEKEVGGVAFPRTSGEFDYLGFTSKDSKFHKWCTDVFKHYWSLSKPKIFNIE